MSSSSVDDPLLVPLQLQAFVLNPAVCGNGEDDESLIAPFAQPNYTFLRLSNFMIQSDVQPHTDLHSAAPSTVNPRMSNLGVFPLDSNDRKRRNRHGVYVHWVLPRGFRSGMSFTDSTNPAANQAERLRRGLAPGDPTSSPSDTTPAFIEIPTRWLVIRRLDLASIKPAGAEIDEFEGWVIESDRKWKLDDIQPDQDLQVDVSPFVQGIAGEGTSRNLLEQAEVFLGERKPAAGWTEPGTEDHVDLSLLKSGNQLFADFQMHNSNILSMLDNFKCSDGTYLDTASADYYLFGWYSSPAKDPLWGTGAQTARSDRLKSLFMSLQDSKIPDTAAWTESKDPARVICHGAMYGVQWNDTDDPAQKPKAPADTYATTLRSKEFPAISVGASPLDALISYITARKDTEMDQTIKKLEEDIIAIESLLHAQDDGVEGQREAKDLVYRWNFQRSPGGKHWHIGGQNDGSKLVLPDKPTIDALNNLNQLQLLLDTSTRTLDQYRWDMFSSWWRYVGDSNNEDPQHQTIYKAEADKIFGHITALETQVKNLQSSINNLLPANSTAVSAPVTTSPSPSIPAPPVNPLKEVKAGTMQTFYRANDPTVLIGGIKSGWANDYLSDAAVRIPRQITVPTTPPPDKFLSLIASVKLPADMAPYVEILSTLGAELSSLRTDNNQGLADDGRIYPQFHDTSDDETTWRDRWGNIQPWFPLFTEWEVEYTHVPMGPPKDPDIHNYWSLDQTQVRLSADARIRYGIDKSEKQPLYTELNTDPKDPDLRALSGRVLVLPQPTFSLAAKVRQLFDSTPKKILEKYLPDATERQNLIDNIGKLQYLSLPLSGFTDGMVTQAQGSHIKPINKMADGTTAALKAAEFTEAGFRQSYLEAIMEKSSLSPYGSLVRFPSEKHCPFKPVTHGQFKFTKLNIIDKFGQALAAIDPRPSLEPPPPVYPCISDFYEPQTITVDGKTIPNTVQPQHDDHCEFFQVPPQINQNARLNGCFLVPNDVKPLNKGVPPSPWRPSNEWENPVWGWVVINYADFGLQFFLPEGDFYREVRIGGPNNSLPGPKWAPFGPAENTTAPQLDALLDKLSNPDYLNGYWNMITKSLDSSPATPAAYSQFLQSILGKPLALVNMGWSLELAGPELKNQSTLATVKEPDVHLLADPSDPNRKVYSFQIKLGDSEREYDGLVGYYDSISDNTTFDLDYINTYFPDADYPVLHTIDTTNYPQFSATWINPEDRKAADYTNLHNATLRPFAAVLDPFTPVHAYSSLLPTQTLLLPTWTWQQALLKMTAFFHMGPMTTTSKLPAYDANGKLDAKYEERLKKVPPAQNLLFPGLASPNWSWLQPFVDPDQTATYPAYNALGLETKGDQRRPGFQKAPYTAVEGYLQLNQPLSGSDFVPTPPKPSVPSA